MKRPKLSRTLLLLILCDPSRMALGEPIRLSMDDALRLAAGATTEIVDGRRGVAGAKAEVTRSQAILPGDPQLAFGAYHSTLKEDLFNEDGELTDRRGYGPNYTFTLSQELEVGMQRNLRRAAADKALERSRLALRFQRQNLDAIVKTAFVHALIENAKLSLAQRAREAMLQLDEMRAPGNGQPLSASQRVAANQVRIQQAHANRELTQAQRSRDQAMASLRRLCRLSPTDEIELVGRAEEQPQPVATLDEIIQRAVDNRPDLASLQKAIDAADAALAARQREKIPNVTVTASVSQFAGATLAGGEISAPIPLFRGNKGDIEDALADRKQAGREIDLTKLDIIKEVTEAHSACSHAARSLKAYQDEIVPLNEENARLQQQLFEEDEIGIAELIGTQVDAFTAQLEYLSAIEDYNASLFELQRAVAGDIAPAQVEAPVPTAETP